MRPEQRIAALFRMDDATWARHASPWSVWTRVPILAALILAGWSRAWIGWWAALPLAALVFWTWLNPRVFPPPAFTDSWASKAVFGERVWLNRDRVPIPPHHRLAPQLLTAVAVLGTVLALWGVVALAVWPTLLGAALAYGGKLWFTDRMVWLYEDMKDADPVYRSWLRRRPQ